MKKSIRTILPAALAGLLAGCAEQTPKMMSIDGGSCEDPRTEYRERADAFMESYVPPEDALPAEYAPERRSESDYDASAATARDVYENVGLFLSAKKWGSLSAEYRGSADAGIFRLTAERTGAKLRLESRDPKTDAILFAAEAEIPEVVQMPGNIPAQMEENVSREMNMIFQFLMNPGKPAKTVSLKSYPMMNAVTKKVENEPQEFLVGDCFCNRLEVVLKELYGGGLLYLYVSSDPKHEIRRIDFADLVLRSGARGAFSLLFPVYTTREGFSVPETVVFNGVEYKLSDFRVTRLPEPAPAAEGKKASQDENASSDSSEDDGEKEKKADEDKQKKSGSAEKDGDDEA